MLTLAALNTLNLFWFSKVAAVASRSLAKSRAAKWNSIGPDSAVKATASAGQAVPLECDFEAEACGVLATVAVCRKPKTRIL